MRALWRADDCGGRLRPPAGAGGKGTKGEEQGRRTCACCAETDSDGRDGHKPLGVV
jgi:hypothetical protein